MPLPFYRVIREKRSDNILNINTFLIILSILFLIGALPTWPHSINWGYYPQRWTGLGPPDPARTGHDWTALTTASLRGRYGYP